jgi:gliding motility-associated-like protein
MRKQALAAYLCLFLLCTSSLITAQIVATPSVGCAPLAVSFSGPSGATGVYWTLGAGMGTSTLSNPSPLYVNPGTYNITYTAIVGGNPVSYNTQVVVTAGPTGSFQFNQPPTHCAPHVVSFSAVGGNPQYSYLWSFGDLTPFASGTSVTHTYQSAGSFNPVLLIVDAVTGCTSVATNPSGTIHVSSPPVPFISASNGMNGCSPPFTTAFSGTSSTSGSPIPGPLAAYTWTFQGGNPGSGSGANAGPVVFMLGQHTVHLRVTDNNQCSATASAIVTVINPSLSVQLQPTVCLSAPLIPTVVTTHTLITWTHTGIYPAVMPYTYQPNIPAALDSIGYFHVPGINSLTASINPGNNCPATTFTMQIFAEEVTASFTNTPPHSTCHGSMVANYINTSSVNTSHSLTYTWTLDGGANGNNGFPIPQTGTNATFTYTQYNPNPYHIYRNWIPRVWLYAQSNSIAQCLIGVSYTIYDTVRRPTAWFNTSSSSGCAPLSVTFRDSSFTMVNAMSNPVYPITGYTLFSGGAPTVSVSGTSAMFPYTFNYPSAGTYSPFLIVTTQNGCIDTSFIQTINVVNVPSVGITFTPNLVACALQPVQVNLSALPSNSVMQHWHVNSDQGFFFGCVNNSSPSWHFSHTGVHGFTVSAYQHNCESTSATSQSITIKGPVGRFRYRTTCDPGTRRTVSFSCHLQEVNTATLYFGDNSSVVINSNPTAVLAHNAVHTYSAGGNYSASLVSQNPFTGCANDTYTMVVTVRELEAKITYSGQPLVPHPGAIGCSRFPYTFSGLQSIDELAGCERGYLWRLITPIDTLMPVDNDTGLLSTDTLYDTGTYNIRLIVKDINGCSDTTSHTFRLSDTKVSFSLNPTPLCLSSGTTQVINITPSLQFPGDSIVNYQWDFGDFSPPLTSTNPAHSPVHTYSYAASPSSTFLVTGTATNNVGCRGTNTAIVTVNNPYPDFQTQQLYPCLPKNAPRTVTFSAYPGYATYSVSYGNPPTQWYTTSSFTSASHNYWWPGTYIATLIVIDNAGCRATETKTITAIGQATSVINFKDGINKFCFPATPSITAAPLLNITPVTNYIWTVGNVSSPPPGSTVLSHPFTTTGITTISLTVDSAGFCPHTATAQVFVFDPKARAVLSRPKFCYGETIQVSIADSSGVGSWRWFFGDNVPQQEIYSGSVLAQLTKTLNYPYTVMPSDSTGKTTLSLRYIGPYGTCVRASNLEIQVFKINAGFVQSEGIYRHCLDLPDKFNSTTGNPAALNLGYSWKFGDQQTGSGFSASHTFTQPGVYTVTLDVTDQDYGCTGSAAKSITVLPLPQASLDVKPGTVCPNDTFMLYGSGKPGISGGLTGTLSPAAGAFSFSPQNEFTVRTSVAGTTTFALVVTDENSCVSRPDSGVIVIPDPLPGRHWDTTIVIGQTVQLNAYGGGNFTYTWTPETRYLSCTACHSPVSTTTDNIIYTVEIIDQPMQCYLTVSTFTIWIDPRVSLDVPTAFTPNGDGVNDEIYPDGWGLKRIIYFKIYNRWGQLLYHGQELKSGWDGTYQGVPQNMETYVYQVSAETLTREVLTKTGSFKLLR